MCQRYKVKHCCGATRDRLVVMIVSTYTGIILNLLHAYNSMIICMQYLCNIICMEGKHFTCVFKFFKNTFLGKPMQNFVLYYDTYKNKIAKRLKAEL